MANIFADILQAIERLQNTEVENTARLVSIQSQLSTIAADVAEIKQALYPESFSVPPASIQLNEEK